MRLLIPFRFFPNSMKGGIEETFYAIVQAMVKDVDTLIILSERSYQPVLKTRLPKQRNLVIESYPRDLSLLRRGWMFILEKLVHVFELGEAHPLRQSLKTAQHNHSHRYWEKINSEYLNTLVQKYDATHCLYFFYRFQTLPILSIPIFALVHDLWWNEVPCDSRVRNRENARLAAWLQRCDRIFATSEHTQEEIMRVVPHGKTQVKVIPLGITVKQIERVKPEAFCLSQGNLFFYPAQFKPNKNHITLLQAAHQLATEGYEYKIVLTGFRTDWLVHDEPLADSQLEACRLFYHLHQSLLAPHFQLLGYCERSQIEQLYSICRAVVLPTIYEGFGLPLVESLARGVPVICTDLAVFREHVTRYDCEDCVNFFSPQDSAALAQCLISSIQGPKTNILSDSLRQKLSRWTWEDVVNAYLQEMTYQK